MELDYCKSDLQLWLMPYCQVYGLEVFLVMSSVATHVLIGQVALVSTIAICFVLNILTICTRVEIFSAVPK